MENNSKYNLSTETIVSEKELIAASVENPEKFEALYNKYYKQILVFVYQRANSKDDAYDITSQVFLINALYFPLQSLKYIREIYLNDIINHGGKKSGQFGIFIDDEGYLFLPLRIYLPQEGALNLIPVDYFVNATMKIIANVSSVGIYHLTNNSHTKLEIISVYNEQFMKIKGVEIIYGKSADNVLRNPAEELFDRFIEPYRSYLSDNRIFERVNTDLITENLYPPEFTNEIFKNCMEYAISVNWGESIFADENMKSQHVKEYS